MEAPLCPVTGRPAARFVQWVSTRLLIDLWRIEFGVDARPSFSGIEHFGLWESPVGLYFFDPRPEGEAAFYKDYYTHLQRYGVSVLETWRAEFETAGSRIPPGARVLDVSCGLAHFRKSVPHAIYTGIDPHFTSPDPAVAVRTESLADHLVANAASYDAVCAFQVLEHLAAPVPFFREMVEAAKPGGLVIIGVPHVPSAMTRIPNFLLSAPPHHLTWWTKPALAALAAEAGLEVESIEVMPWTRFDALIYWIERCSFVKCEETHFRGTWTWPLAAALALVLGRIVHMFREPPKAAGGGAGLLLVAKRPERPTSS
jgi:SAM-dependent methyltransferase